MAKAYSYIRFSTSEQLDGDSLRRQQQANRLYAQTHGLELVELHDHGKSAFHGEHVKGGVLGDFLARLEAQEIEKGSVLIVENLDRLSRQSPFEAFAQFSTIISADIKIVVGGAQNMREFDRENLSDFGMLIMSLVEMHRAHSESQAKSERARANWQNAREKAKELGKPITSNIPAWLRLSADREKFEIIEERADVMRAMFRMSADGLGAGAIASELNARGTPTFGKGMGWRATTVQRYLSTKATIGIFIPSIMKAKGKYEPLAEALNLFPPIIDEELYWLAQASRTSRRSGGGPKGARGINLLSGLCRCAICGGGISRVSTKKRVNGGTYNYIKCENMRRNNNCPNKTVWRYEDVEDAVLRHISRIDLAHVFGEQRAMEKVVGEINLLEVKILERRDSIARFHEAIKMGSKTVIPLLLQEEARLEAEEAQVESLKKTQAELQRDEISPVERAVQFGRLRRKLDDAQGDDRLQVRRQLNKEMKRLIKRIEFSERNVKIILSSNENEAACLLERPDAERGRFLREMARVLNAKII